MMTVPGSTIVHLRRVTCIAMMLLLTMTPGFTVSAQDAGPDLAWSSVIPERLGTLRSDAGDLPRYEISATLTIGDRKQPAVVTGFLKLTIPPSRLDGPAIALRLYPNDPGYEAGGMVLRRVDVDGVTVTPEFRADDTVALLPLPSGVTRGEPALVAVEFETTVPVHSRHAFGMFSVKPESGVVALAHWYPMLAGETAEGPDLAAPSQIGDPVFSIPSMFDVTVDAPAELSLVTGGVTLDRSEDGDRQVVRFATGPAREAPIVAGVQWVPVTVAAGSVAVNVWATAADAESARRVAEWAAAALAVFGVRFGAYPYRELDIAVTDLYGAAGMEFPGMVLISPDILAGSSDERRFSEMVVAHEVAHQWWYAMVLNDQNAEAFIDEGLSEYAAAEIYFSDRYGPEEGRRQFELLVADWMSSQLASGGDVLVDQPTESFGDRTSYAAAVYAKASLGFDAIRERIGDEAFFAALQGIVQTRRFETIGGNDLQRSFEDECGCNLGPVWDAWFEHQDLRSATPINASPVAST